jgi:hypothetical protein
VSALSGKAAYTMLTRTGPSFLSRPLASVPERVVEPQGLSPPWAGAHRHVINAQARGIIAEAGVTLKVCIMDAEATGDFLRARAFVTGTTNDHQVRPGSSIVGRNRNQQGRTGAPLSLGRGVARTRDLSCPPGPAALRALSSTPEAASRANSPNAIRSSDSGRFTSDTAQCGNAHTAQRKRFPAEVPLCRSELSHHALPFPIRVIGPLRQTWRMLSSRGRTRRGSSRQQCRSRWGRSANGGWH